VTVGVASLVNVTGAAPFSVRPTRQMRPLPMDTGICDQVFKARGFTQQVSWGDWERRLIFITSEPNTRGGGPRTLISQASTTLARPAESGKLGGRKNSRRPQLTGAPPRRPADYNACENGDTPLHALFIGTIKWTLPAWWSLLPAP